MTFAQGIALTQTLVLLITLVVVSFYTWETRQMRQQVFQQREEMRRQTLGLESNLRATAYNDAMLGQRSLWLTLFLHKPELLAWYLTSRGIPTSTELENELRLYAVLKYDFHESLFLRHHEKVLSDDAWRGWLNVLAADLRLPPFQETWPHISAFYAPRFTDFIDSRLEPMKA